KNLVVKYFFYLAQVIEFDLFKSGSAVPSMTQSTLNEIQLPKANVEEQIMIVEYLDLKTQELSCSITRKQQLIVELESYKKSLIYEVVTGKKEV
ncbi:MAG: hypothetical protein P9L91_09710, partial [Candidatus Zophobacter franzmannii]|nr:hypothetical protein [Candidatus Zophobacter franzmannii]